MKYQQCILGHVVWFILRDANLWSADQSFTPVFCVLGVKIQTAEITYEENENPLWGHRHSIQKYTNSVSFVVFFSFFWSLKQLKMTSDDFLPTPNWDESFSLTPGISPLLSPLTSSRTCWVSLCVALWPKKNKKQILIQKKCPAILPRCPSQQPAAPSPPPSLPLDFSFPSSDTEMRLEIEWCIFHEVPNASALAAPPQSGLCFALSIPNNFFFSIFFIFLWFDCLFLSQQNKAGGNKSRDFMRFPFFSAIRRQPIIASVASAFVAFLLNVGFILYSCTRGVITGACRCILFSGRCLRYTSECVDKSETFTVDAASNRPISFPAILARTDWPVSACDLLWQVKQRKTRGKQVGLMAADAIKLGRW